LFIYAMPVEGVTLETLEAAIDKVWRSARDGVSAADVARASTRLVADAVSPRTTRRAWRAGSGGARQWRDRAGRLGWSARMEAVTVEMSPRR